LKFLLHDPYGVLLFGVAAHPWIRSNNVKIPLDIIVYRLVRAYLRATSMRRAALKVNDEEYVSSCFPLYCIIMAGGGTLSLFFCIVNIDCFERFRQKGRSSLMQLDAANHQVACLIKAFAVCNGVADKLTCYWIMTGVVKNFDRR
jgi:hypothetical protein